MQALVPLPATGRVFRGERRVRLADASPKGRLRLDAVARYLQDVAADDTREAGLDGEAAWVLRRSTIVVDAFPRFEEVLGLATWCSGVGRRWAERRTSIEGRQGGRVEAASLWVHVDRASQRPAPLPPGFLESYGEAAGGRTVSAGLRLDGPPPGDGPEVDRWPARYTDFDVVGHMNNAAYWEAVEQVLTGRRDLRAPLRAELEHRAGIGPGEMVDLLVVDEPAMLTVWWRVDDKVRATARVRPETW